MGAKKRPTAEDDRLLGAGIVQAHRRVQDRGVPAPPTLDPAAGELGVGDQRVVGVEEVLVGQRPVQQREPCPQRRPQPVPPAHAGVQGRQGHPQRPIVITHPVLGGDEGVRRDADLHLAQGRPRRHGHDDGDPSATGQRRLPAPQVEAGRPLAVHADLHVGRRQVGRALPAEQHAHGHRTVGPGLDEERRLVRGPEVAGPPPLPRVEALAPCRVHRLGPDQGPEDPDGAPLGPRQVTGRAGREVGDVEVVGGAGVVVAHERHVDEQVVALAGPQHGAGPVPQDDHADAREVEAQAFGQPGQVHVVGAQQVDGVLGVPRQDLGHSGPVGLGAATGAPVPVVDGDLHRSSSSVGEHAPAAAGWGIAQPISSASSTICRRRFRNRATSIAGSRAR